MNGSRSTAGHGQNLDWLSEGEDDVGKHGSEDENRTITVTKRGGRVVKNGEIQFRNANTGDLSGGTRIARLGGTCTAWVRHHEDHAGASV